MGQLFDPQFANITDFDCFSQAYFRDIEDYKAMKKDPYYREHLMGDHEVFADTKKSWYVGKVPLNLLISCRIVSMLDG